MLARTVVFAAVALGLSASALPAQGWGTIKGKVVLDADKVPEPKKANVNKDETHCLSKGPIYTNDLVVNKKNKGVRWVLVWLTDPKDGNNASFVPPIHPGLKDFAKKKVEIDQPCCVFEPRVLGLMKGQTLVVKNSAPVAHNFKINAIGGGPAENPVIEAGGKREITGFLPKVIPTNYSCSFHPWMGGYVGTFAHPYFTVTNADGEFEIKNAPAGKFRLMVWHESGFVLINPKRQKTDRGKVIEIKAGGTTDVGAVKMKLPE